MKYSYNRSISKRTQRIARGTIERSVAQMNLISPFRRWLASLVLLTTVIVIFYKWLDGQIAIWVHDVLLPYHTHDFLNPGRYDPLVPLAGVVLILIGLRSLFRRTPSKVSRVAIIGAVSILTADATKILLKYLFGRNPPDALFAAPHHAMGFRWFYTGASSFPSGHTAAVCAAATVLWLCYPQFRPIYLLGMLMIAAALISANFHFVSDVLAGAFLGITAGWLMMGLFGRLLKA